MYRGELENHMVLDSYWDDPYEDCDEDFSWIDREYDSYVDRNWDEE